MKRILIGWQRYIDKMKIEYRFWLVIFFVKLVTSCNEFETFDHKYIFNLCYQGYDSNKMKGWIYCKTVKMK